MATPGVGSIGRYVHGDNADDPGINYSNQELPPPTFLEYIFYSRRYTRRSLYQDIINQLNRTSVSGFPLQPLTDTAAAEVQFWEATV